MRRFIAFFAVAAALAVAPMAEQVWAQAGNTGGTIGKKDKVVTGGDQPPKKASPRTRSH